ncbi:LysR family transcriptional regulator [Pararhodobacter aggregans]|uniref:LysR family transcriptional regulator n=1 Tax=Pararhodobacter aggregans TaxID=404875 RepID=A0A2T7UNE6_9RHOB|nr:LysR family transcriptional regulator [Pararhodobacter aggregans]PTX00701.1 transcriptional regulator /LysR family transcriptional regulator [Pararhodobacter aggregans]PVE46240.1 LysR family transcriptional regulator [Pararhodobacter aggregans]
MIDKLEMLIALARERHFGRAAETCHVTQPTLSSAIKSLEDQLGVQLVQRGARFIGLTPEGERVLARAKSIVAEARALKSDVAVAREGLSGTLRLGVIPTALASVHDLTRPFLDSHPGVRLRILSLNSHLIVEKLTEFEIDAGLSYASADQPADRLPGYTTMPLYEESYALVTRKHPDLPASMAWADVAGYELGLLTPDMQNRRIIDRNLKRAGVAVTPRLESNSIIGLVSHVTEHHSATILPSRTAVFYATGRDLVCIPLTGGVSGIADVALLLPPLGRRTLLLDAFIESIAQEV